jgi:hydrogenase maturation protein HypF
MQGPVGADRAGTALEQPSVVDWAPVIFSILDDAREGKPLQHIAEKFHNTLVEIIVAVADRVGEPRVVLTGGCFQNKVLLERSVRRLKERGFRPYWHQRIPPNDGCIAPGQVAAVSGMPRWNR